MQRHTADRFPEQLWSAPSSVFCSRTSVGRAQLLRPVWVNSRLSCSCCSGMTVLAPKASRERVATTVQETTTGTLHKRTTIWKAGLSAWKNRRFIGVGSGAYPDAVRPIIGTPGVPGHEYVAHNSHLSILVETGLLGSRFMPAFSCHSQSSSSVCRVRTVPCGEPSCSSGSSASRHSRGSTARSAGFFLQF